MKNDSNSLKAIPTTQEFCASVPIYKEYDISQTKLEELVKLQTSQETIDSYCVECRQQSVFQKKAGREPEIITLKDRDFAITFICSRDQRHQMKFYFRINSLKISKVGQYPSLADLHLQDIAKYRKILEEKEYSEFAKAVGLHAHGIGIGSFVYMRRIFENLIETAHQKTSDISDWNDEVFQKSRMHEKISLLKEYLPETLVKNANIYSILSKGIHDLTEDECLEHFSTIRLGIELILDEEIEKREREKKVKGLTDEIGRIHGQLGDTK